MNVIVVLEEKNLTNEVFRRNAIRIHSSTADLRGKRKNTTIWLITRQQRILWKQHIDLLRVSSPSDSGSILHICWSGRVFHLVDGRLHHRRRSIFNNWSRLPRVFCQQTFPRRQTGPHTEDWWNQIDRVGDDHLDREKRKLHQRIKRRCCTSRRSLLYY